MTEKIITLHTIEPIGFYGANNINFDLLKQFFPKVKIIARDNLIKVIGEEVEINYFETKLFSLVDYYERYNSLSPGTVKDILYNETYSNGDNHTENSNGNGGVILFGINGKAIRARTINQKVLVNEIQRNDLIFAIGPAGTGKTYTAVALAVRALKNKEVKRIILCRPAVEAEEKLGFLPGDMREKLNPYLQPLYDALMDMIPAKRLPDMFEDGTLQIAPLAYMRGRTLDNAFVILDEAQNATLNQLKMFLTRMGENAKFVLTGDITQIDLPDKRKSGLLKVLKHFENIEGISVIKFEERDIIRHRLVRFIVDVFDKHFDESQ
ncbi:MAG: PhoH family protein [Bacteroidales bacterium]